MRPRGSLFALLAALACLAPPPAVASTARLAGMGLQSDYGHDPTAMFTYLSALTSAGDRVSLEAGSMAGATANRDRAMGAVLSGLGHGRAGTWAIHMRRIAPALGQAWTGQPINPGFLAGDPNDHDESLDLMWGRRFAGGSAAVRFQRSFNSSDDGTTRVEGVSPTQRNVTGFGLGIGLDDLRGLPVEVAGQFQGRAFRTATQRDDGGFAYLFAARSFARPATGLECVPVVKFYKLNLPWTTIGSPARNQVHLSGWQAGGAANWAVGSGDLLVLGAYAASNALDLGTTRATETYAPTVFAALEASLNPWLTLRAGARSDARLTLEQRAGGAIARAQGSAFAYSMGAAVRLGGLVLDAVLDPAFLNNPFGQLLGSESAAFDGWRPEGGARVERTRGTGPGAAFPMVSVTYAW